MAGSLPPGRRSRRDDPRRSAVRIGAVAAAFLGAALTAVGPGRSEAELAAAPEPVSAWQFVDTVVNPTGAAPNEGWQVSVGATSMSVVTDIFPTRPGSTAQATFTASWETPPVTLVPATSLDLAATVTGQVSGPRDEGFFAGFSLISLVDGGWNRDYVSTEANCVERLDGAGGLVCSDPTEETGTLTFGVPGAGDTMSIGVGVLNCGEACEVQWNYEWAEAEPGGPSASGGETEPRDGEESAPGETAPLADRVTNGELLDALSEDDFAEADVLGVAWTVVADEYLGGRNSVTALRTLRDLLDDFLDDKIRQAENNDRTTVIATLQRVRDSQLAALDEMIEAAQARELDEARTRLGVLHEVLTMGVDGVEAGDPLEPDPRVQAIVRDLREADESRELSDALDGQLLRAVDDRAPLDDDEPADDDDEPADDDGEAAEGGDTGDDGGTTEGGPGTAPPSTAPPDTVPTPDEPPGPGGADLEQKPIGFTNLGVDAVTVRPATYEPAPGLEDVAMSRASTIVFPDTNPSGYLSLPQGTYTFCYDWDLPDDADGDGVIDQRHALTRSITLDENTSDDPVRAPIVDLDPSAGGEPGGCGGTGMVLGPVLSDRELAAVEPATYQIACDHVDGTSSDRTTTYWFEFVDDGALWWEVDATSGVSLRRLDQDYYLVEGDQTIWLEFFEGGFEVWGDGVGSIQNCSAVRQP